MNLSAPKVYHLLRRGHTIQMIITLSNIQDCGKFASVCEITIRAVMILSTMKKPVFFLYRHYVSLCVTSFYYLPEFNVVSYLALCVHIGT